MATAMGSGKDFEEIELEDNPSGKKAGNKSDTAKRRAKNAEDSATDEQTYKASRRSLLIIFVLLAITCALSVIVIPASFAASKPGKFMLKCTRSA